MNVVPYISLLYAFFSFFCHLITCLFTTTTHQKKKNVRVMENQIIIFKFNFFSFLLLPFFLKIMFIHLSGIWFVKQNKKKKKRNSNRVLNWIFFFVWANNNNVYSKKNHRWIRSKEEGKKVCFPCQKLNFNFFSIFTPYHTHTHTKALISSNSHNWIIIDVTKPKTIIPFVDIQIYGRKNPFINLDIIKHWKRTNDSVFFWFKLTSLQNLKCRINNYISINSSE